MKFPKIFEHFHQGQVFTIDEAKNRLHSQGNTLRKRLSELANRGYIKPIRQGLYQMCVITPSEPIFPFEPFAIAAKLSPFGAISFGSALLYHCDSSSHMPTIYIQSPSKFNNFHSSNTHFVWCHSEEATGLITLEKDHVGYTFPFLITNFERTIVDCLKKPLFAPPPSQMLALCHSINFQPNLMKLLRYAFSGNESPALFNRLGYFLESLTNLWEVPPEVLEGLKKRSTSRITPWYHTRGRPSEVHFTVPCQDQNLVCEAKNQDLSLKWNLTQSEAPPEGA